MIENKYGDCELACFHCGAKVDLMQVAHRDCNGFIAGYLFLCKKCLPIIGGKYSVSLSEIQTGKAEPTSGFELRPAVRVFAEAMESRLRENDHKGGWGKTQCSIEYLEGCLIGEFAEYLDDKARGDPPEWEAVDIANFAMMLYHRWNKTGELFEK